MSEEIQLDREIVKAIQLVSGIDKEKLKERVDFYNKYVVPLTSKLTDLSLKRREYSLFLASSAIFSILNSFPPSYSDRILKYVVLHLKNLEETQKDAEAVIDLVNRFKEENLHEKRK